MDDNSITWESDVYKLKQFTKSFLKITTHRCWHEGNPETQSDWDDFSYFQDMQVFYRNKLKDDYELMYNAVKYKNEGIKYVEYSVPFNKETMNAILKGSGGIITVKFLIPVGSLYKFKNAEKFNDVVGFDVFGNEFKRDFNSVYKPVLKNIKYLVGQKLGVRIHLGE